MEQKSLKERIFLLKKSNKIWLFFKNASENKFY